MSSKISKSEKGKSKFAQSNINYVYKGNAAESSHKPATRQYGMQVVGKLQGTRRLPPPAWVPSIKAESGGLDRRVALVPAGGTGWGAQPAGETESTSTEPLNTPANTSAPTTSLPVINGSLAHQDVSATFEPAYTRLTSVAYSSSDVNHNDSTLQTPAAEQSITQPRTGLGDTSSSVTRKIPSATTTGGLAANKPFFQRPTPVTTASSSTTQRVSGTKSAVSHKQSRGASEIIGSPVGWAAVGDDEPNFNEKILFSDEEEEEEAQEQYQDEDDNQSEPKQGTRTHLVVGDSGSSTPSLDKPLNGTATIQQSSRADLLPPPPSVASCYPEHASRNMPDVWSSLDESQTNHMPLVNPTSSSRHFFTPLHDTFVNDGMGPGSHYAQHPVSAPMLPNQPDSFYTGDSNLESQNVQRQVRTQEFKSAVERARLARQKSDVYSPETESVHRSIAGLLAENEDAKTTIGRVPSNAQATHNVQQTFANNQFPQMLFSSVYQQAMSQNHPDLATAVAAAKAIAMACSEPTNAPFRPGDNIYPSPNLQCPPSGWPNHLQTPHSTAMYPGRPTPVLQNSVPLAPGALPPGRPANAVFLNPQHFVQHFLQLLNHQQSVKPAIDPMSSIRKSNAQSSTPDSTAFVGPAQSTTTTFDDFKEATTAGKAASSTVSTQSTAKPESPKSSEFTQSAQSMSNMTRDRAEVTPVSKTETKRVPGLMEVKVSTVSRNFSFLWDQDDAGASGGRTRSNKIVSERGRVSSRNKRQLFHRQPFEEAKNQKHHPSSMRPLSGDYSNSYSHATSHTRTWQISRSKPKSDSEPPNVDYSNRDDKQLPPSEEHVDMSDANESQSRGVKKPSDTPGSHRPAFVSVSKSQYTSSRGSADYQVAHSEKYDYHHRPGGFSRRSRGFSHQGYSSRTFPEEEDRYHSSTDTKYRGGYSSNRGRSDGNADSHYRGGQTNDAYRQRDTQASARSHPRGATRGAYHTSRDYPSLRTYSRGYHSRHQDTRTYRQASGDPSRQDEHSSVDEPDQENFTSTTQDHKAVRKSSDMNDPTSEEKVETSNPVSGIQIPDDFEDNDIPTVRVPATDMGLATRASHSRPAVVPTRRGTGRAKRSVPGMSPQTTRRYREMRNRYHDDDNDDDDCGSGGATTGGGMGGSSFATRSAASRLTDVASQSHSGGGSGHIGGRTRGGSQDVTSSPEAGNANGSNHNNADACSSAAESRLRPTSHTSDYRRGQYTKLPYSYPSRGFRGGAQSGFSFRYRQNNTRHMNVSEIPPLMSIKAVGTFPRDYLDHAEGKKKTKGSEHVDATLSPRSNSETSSDEFTEVVSKTSKRISRRLTTQSSVSTTCMDEVNTKLDTRKVTNEADEREYRTTTTTTTARKAKSTCPKPTFMGPPLPTVTFSQATSLEGDSGVPVSSTVCPVPTESQPSSHRYSSRVWSKVVGTRTLPVSSTSDETIQATETTESGSQNMAPEPGAQSFVAPPSTISINGAINATNVESSWASTERSVSSYSTLARANSSAADVNSVAPIISNNVCKVKPQQQSVPSSTASFNLGDSSTVVALSSSDAPETAYDAVSELSSATHQKCHSQIPSISMASDTPSNYLTSNYDLARLGISQTTASNFDAQFSSAFWQPSDSSSSLEVALSRLQSNVTMPFAQLQNSDNMNNNLLGNLPTENAAKMSHQLAVIPRNHQAYNVPAAVTSAAAPFDSSGMYYPSLDESGKYSAPNPIYPNSLFMPPQHVPPHHHQFSANWSLQPSHPQIPQQLLPPPQRYRQRLSHQGDQQAFQNFPYQSKIQSEYPGFPGSMQPGTSDGLYSTQPTFHTNAHRPGVPPTANPNPWSLLSNSSVLAPNQDYNSLPFAANSGFTNADAALLSHVHAGYNTSLPISTSPTPNFLTHAYGSGTDLTQNSVRHRIYAPHALSRSSSVQSQPQPVHSAAFYPSISPSHQRMQFQQFTHGSHGNRTAVPGLMNPHGGLFTASFGAHSGGNPPGTPPIAPPSHNFSALGLHHLPGHRSDQAALSSMSSRNLGALANHGGSHLLLANPVAQSALTPIPGYTQPPTPIPPGCQLKPILPTM